jgi:DNA-binding MarR family transcriptional regulator
MNRGTDGHVHGFRATPAMRLRHAYLNMHRTCDAHFRQFGITTDQFVVLSILAEQEGINQQELARAMASDPNTIAAMAALLDRKRLISRASRKGDGRARTLYLTPSGRKLQEELRRGAEGVHCMIEECFRGEDRDAAFQALERVAEAMSRARPTRRRGMKSYAAK